jgi:uncharacterized protein YqjF (DUF2071 family)
MPVDTPSRPFLTAEWRYLAMLNYAVSPELIAHLVPSGTELDRFQGSSYVSLVGFRFLRTRVRGLWVPFHSDFDEVNLRFYVRRGDRRGVVFIREIVPRFAIAKVAQIAFHENYVSLPMAHQVIEPTSEYGRVEAEYRWRHQQKWNSLRVECSGRPVHAVEGSIEQFITEHYWGYAAQPDGGCLEYQVEHERWRVWNPTVAKFRGETTGLYGPQLAGCLDREPDSAFLAEGSSVAVFPGQRI